VAPAVFINQILTMLGGADARADFDQARTRKA
jgi:hypothetical protein